MSRAGGGDSAAVAVEPGAEVDDVEAARAAHHDLLSALADPMLLKLFDETLGNLPLSVAQVGQMFRTEHPRLATVADLVEEMGRVDMKDVDITLVSGGGWW